MIRWPWKKRRPRNSFEVGTLGYQRCRICGAVFPHHLATCRVAVVLVELGRARMAEEDAS